MFGAKYDMAKFWATRLSVFLIIWFLVTFATIFGAADLKPVFLLVGQVALMSILANRIRDYGSGPWSALWSLIPFVGLIQALYFGIKHKKLAK